MMPRYHVDDDLLLSYAAGSLAEGWSLAVSTHLALCPECRARLAAAEAAGGALLEAMTPVPVAADAWASVRDRLGSSVPAEARSRPAPAVIPSPLRDYIGGDVETIRWKAIGTAGAQLRIKTSDGTTQVRLLKIPAGQPVPEHGHRGRELTVVLSGAFSDGAAVFARGDIEDADEEVQHTPTATPGADCICLAVTDAPLRFRSWLVRAVQPLLGI